MARSRVRTVLVRGLWGGVGLATAVLVLGQIGLAVVERWSWRRDPMNVEFETTCGECHPASKAHAYALSPDGWRRTVARMLRKRAEREAGPGREPRAIDAAQVDRLASFLARHRSADGATLFHARCGRCHSPGRIGPYLALEPEALRLLVAQHVRANNATVQTWEGDLIVEKLLADRAARPPAASTTAPGDATAYQRDCGACHTPRMIRRDVRARAKTPEERAALIDRMRGKAPDLIVERDVPALRRYLEAICASGNVAP